MIDSDLRPFQRRFLKGALAPGIDVAALSIPRGNGKSALAGYVLTQCLTPGNPLFADGQEVVLLASSLEQARIVFRFIRADLGESKAYRWVDSSQRIGVTHVPTNTRLRVISSSGKQAMGLVGVRVVVADEPGAWEVVGGQLMADALETALGKPGSPMRVLYIGTLAPALAGWWHDLIERGSHGSIFVQVLTGNADKWDQWPEIRRCNPLTAISPTFRKKLLEERDSARLDTRLAARFKSYRLNLPSADASTMLLTTEDYELLTARPVADREGQPIVGVDLGGGRAWSAAVAIWRTGRIETLALAPGVPDLEAQEKRDRQPAGSYRRLANLDLLATAEGLRVQPPSQLWTLIKERWGIPVNIWVDRFRLPELQDAVKGETTVSPRVSRWSEAAADIRALRQGVQDGPLSVELDSRLLLAASLSVSMVKNDDQGNTRMVKKSTNNTARDDVSAAAVLVAGAFQRANMVQPVQELEYAVV